MERAIRFKSTADYATSEIQRMILAGELAAGERLDQVRLAEQLDVSRHPIRQAIERLAERGFVLLSPHRSAVVSAHSIADLVELYSLRESLEDMALRASWSSLTAGGLDNVAAIYKRLTAQDPEADLERYMHENRAFHLAFYRDCGNRHLLRTITTLFDLSERYQRTALTTSHRQNQSSDEHAGMMDALRAGHLELLSQRLKAHNRGTQEQVRALLSTSAPATVKV
ncbi:MAG: GntR family transcriptional regulator [Chelatococcus sp.]|uniref:GntR family transcriptional regulator n=1 Tax=Chelatococcus sp. TaxID=1953771 RepID=UPI0025C2A4A3|nr:GntR family transcriptional regulator [Chelatococcus sp.]MBX3538143.1 GntR family transcriptional regulator [Chelatococcus sp.]